MKGIYKTIGDALLENADAFFPNAYPEEWLHHRFQLFHRRMPFWTTDHHVARIVSFDDFLFLEWIAALGEPKYSSAAAFVGWCFQLCKDRQLKPRLETFEPNRYENFGGITATEVEFPIYFDNATDPRDQGDLRASLDLATSVSEREGIHCHANIFFTHLHVKTPSADFAGALSSLTSHCRVVVVSSASKDYTASIYRDLERREVGKTAAARTSHIGAAIPTKSQDRLISIWRKTSLRPKLLLSGALHDA